DYGIYVGHRFVQASTDARLDVVDPANGEVLASVPCGMADDVDAAVRSSATAFRTWARELPAHRSRLLLGVAAGVRSNAERLALLESRNTGKPLSQARFDVESAARYFEYYAGFADKFEGSTIPLGPDYVSYTRREPYGVVGVIVPWNAPIQQAARGVAPALAA